MAGGGLRTCIGIGVEGYGMAEGTSGIGMVGEGCGVAGDDYRMTGEGFGIDGGGCGMARGTIDGWWELWDNW